MMVVLGEIGGRDEYSLVEALKQGKVQKPVVAWVSGTCARLFKSEVQFGHAVSVWFQHLDTFGESFPGLNAVIFGPRVPKVAMRWSQHRQKIRH